MEIGKKQATIRKQKCGSDIRHSYDFKGPRGSGTITGYGDFKTASNPKKCEAVWRVELNSDWAYNGNMAYCKMELIAKMVTWKEALEYARKVCD